MNRTRWIIAGFALAIAGLAVAQFLTTHERVKKDVRQPPSGEARKNPYLALERMLGEMGVETTTRQTLDLPVQQTEIYVLADRERDVSPEQIDAWRSWVEQGGHLVVPAPPSGRTESKFLEAIRIQYADDGGNDGSDGEPADETPTGPTYDVTATPGALDGWRATDGDWRARNDSGNRVAFSAPVGRGRVTMTSGVDHLQNHRVGKRDHARFAWETVTLGADSREATATIVRFSTEQGWMGHAAAQTWPFLIVLAVVLLLALNAGRWQFGSEVPTPPSDRRSRVEHIRAIGEFHWEHGAASRLLGATRAALLQALARRRPSLPEVSRREQRRIVREELELDGDAARLIFDDRDHLSESQFEERIELMERYRRTL